MSKYFGTDGARGKANEALTLDMAIRIGQYIGYHYGKDKHARILIGKDTRLSSDMFELAIAAGAISTGSNVYLIGVCPTPCVSYLVVKEKFDCGVMISASHNPFYDNGIKLFNAHGKKMDAEIEELIERHIDGELDVEYAQSEHIGKKTDFTYGLALYESYLKEVLTSDLSDMKIALDLANGSATSCAVSVFNDLGVDCKVIHSNPNGKNINTHCGSTHPEDLQKLVREGKYDVAFAFDGDADRVMAITEDGEIFDGDYILYVASRYLKKQNRLANNVVVTTVMANLGLYKALESQGISFIKTDVGDKYVLEAMDKCGHILGGEQSGHIIFKEHANTGDGLLSALMLMEIMKSEKKSLKELSADLFIYPQVLKNVVVTDKEVALQDKEMNAIVEAIAQELGDDGRILVRPSGTEPLIRVMIEAKTQKQCDGYVQRVVDYMQSKGL